MPSLEESPGFTGRPETHSFSGVLLDMDGTIVDSTDAIVKHWHKIGRELGVDPTVILQSSHGRRSIDTMQLYDPSKANWGYVSHVEGLIPKEFGADAVEVPGAREPGQLPIQKELLASLEAAKAPWAIVTSGTRPLVTGWLDVMKLAHPRNLVVAEDVEEGKPDPECYALGREKLGLRVDTKVLVVEDSPAGIRAGKAASSFVVALATTHTIAQLHENEPDRIVKDLQSIRLVNRNAVTGEVAMEISNWLE